MTGTMRNAQNLAVDGSDDDDDDEDDDSDDGAIAVLLVRPGQQQQRFLIKTGEKRFLSLTLFLICRERCVSLCVFLCRIRVPFLFTVVFLSPVTC